jgi:hypothetical protein
MTIRFTTTEKPFHARDGMRTMFTVKALDERGKLLGAEHVFEDEHPGGVFGSECQRARERLTRYVSEEYGLQDSR